MNNDTSILPYNRHVDLQNVLKINCKDSKTIQKVDMSASLEYIKIMVILVSLDLVVSSSFESVRPLIWRPFAVDKSPTSSDSSTLISPRYM